MRKARFAPLLALLALILFSGELYAQTDPGVQGGSPRAGMPLRSVNSSDGSLQFFQNGLSRFQDIESVSGSSSGNNGLGPRFNFVQCSGCHSQPAVGGTGPGVNPQFQVINDGFVSGSTNRIPSFITQNGPTREARFPFFFDQSGNPDPSAPNGGVEDLFTVSGRSDAGSCNLPQPSFAHAQEANNIIFRIPTPTFGTGLIENLDDSTLIANQEASSNNNLGISGTFNHNGNDGTISRFGWKAQNKSLELFAGEAYNVEMGISNEIFPQDRPLPGEDQLGSGLPQSCLNLSGSGYPEDTTNFKATTGADQFATNASIPSDVVQFAMFMRLLAPPERSTTPPGGAASVSRGAALFAAIGCATCHTATVGNTQASNFTSSLSNVPVNAFSDIEIHHMGTALADNVSQGGAGGDQFRTAPLWGLGQRIFLLHDGRTRNLLAAIQAHGSNGSEATQSEEIFDSLSPSQQQDLLNFLRSL
ncbi:MAG TPA: di-heme oxidoredictase family protein [Candidatus Methylomirabilis sp.]|nr:di-heme oxidoredictase family protein [Candidatus Methylomirabilis sp.]